MDAEQQIGRTISEFESAVEAGSVKQAADWLDSAYSDKRHQTKRAATATLFAYMRRHRNIHLFSVIQQIELDDAGLSAKVVVQLALSGVPVNSKKTLYSIKADLYRFDLVLKHTDDQWLIHSARWRPSNLDVF